jgi:hypothetical protein
MKRLHIFTFGLLLVGALLMMQSRVLAEDAPADNPYAADFTKDMGKYDYTSAEGKHVTGEGLKLTNLKESGGPMLEGPVADVSATPVAVVEMENNGKEPIPLMFKVKSGTDKKSTKDDISVPAGKYTLKVDVSKLDIDPKGLNYVKIFGTGAVDLTIKSIKFVKAE